MNIVYARMAGYEWVSTPSDAVVRELEKLGHKVTICENPDDYVPGKQDFVFSPYESVTVLGHVLSRRLGIPHVSHIEWFPPWRVLDDCDISKYGYSERERDIRIDREYYRGIANLYEKADIKLVGSSEFVSAASKVYQNLNNIEYTVRYPSVDLCSISKVQQMYSPERVPNRVLSVARAVPNKRYDLVVEVMNRITTPVEWVIIGTGPDLKLVDEKLANKNVKVTAYGALWGWTRFYEMLKSSVFIGSWNGMPPVEAELLGCKSFLIRPQNTNEINIEKVFTELFGDAILHSTCFDKMALAIDGFLAKPEKTNMIDALLNNELGIKTSKQNAQDLLKVFINES